jgi:transcriptional regulator with XRE-family HTH domain
MGLSQAERESGWDHVRVGALGQRSNDLGEFLRARRAEVRPDQVGLGNTRQPRRVAGLRREEVAQLAMISADYYARLEQGRIGGASVSVLDAIGDALRLTHDQRSYLFTLANKTASRPRRPAVEKVRPQTQLLLDNLVDTPAIALGRCLDVLAWNTLAASVFTDFGHVPVRERNFVRMLFLHDEVRGRYEDWPSMARTCTAFFRMSVVERPEDPRLAEVVGELAVRDEDFRRWWAGRDVDYQTFGSKSLKHPAAGEFLLDWQLLRSPDDDGQTLMIMTAPADSPRTLDALRFLASWGDVVVR